MNTTESLAPAAPATDALSERDTCPATMAQQSLWFIDQLIPDSAVYTMSRIFLVEGRLDVSALTGALTRVVARHEALRTTFTEVGGRVYQVINPPEPVVPVLLDVSTVPDGERRTAATRAITAEIDRPFDLAEGPLLRCCLVSLGADGHLLAIAIHHIVCDGWSLDLIARELGESYTELRLGTPASTPPAVTQFGDVAAGEADWFADPAFADVLAYWRDRLADTPPHVAPEPDRPRPDPPSYRGANRTFAIPVADARALRALAIEERATLFMATLGAFMLLLGRYARTDDVVVGVPVAGRHRREFEGIVGFFVNTLAIRCDLGGPPTFRELVRRVRDASVDAFAHQDVPFAKVVEELNPERDLTRNPVVQVLFQLTTAAGPSGAPRGALPDLEGAAVSAVDTGNRFTEVDMEVQVIEAGESLEISWIYSTDLYDETTVDRMGRAYVALLGEVALEPDRSIADATALGPDELLRFEQWGSSEAGVHVVDANLQRVPTGVAGELCVAGGRVAAATLGTPAETAERIVPDPFAGEPGARMFATGDLAVVRPDGVVELRGRLHRVARDEDAAPVGFAAPLTRREQVIAGIWTDLLGVALVGRHDDFFDLGGHSILAIRAIIMLREEFDCDLPLRTIFDAPSVAAMAEAIEANLRAAAPPPSSTGSEGR